MKAFLILLMMVVFSFQQAFAQKVTGKERRAAKVEEVHQLIKSGNFRFVARTATPLAGSKIDLTSPYDLEMRGDSVKAYLPYFGRAYQASYGSSDGGIKFEELSKEKTVEFNERKSSYLISFEVKDQRDSYKISLSVGVSGYADLRISPTNRQAISYYGIVEALPKKVE